MEKTSGEKSQLCLPNNGPYPWLVYSHGRGEKSRTFCSISKPYNCQKRNFPALCNKQISSCCFGWALLLSEVNDPFHFSLWNPLSLKSIHFPPLPREANKGVSYAILSSPPTSPDSMVFLFLRNCSYMIVCRVTDKYWNVVNYGEKLREIGVVDTNDGVLSGLVTFDGKICARVYLGGFKLLSLRMDDLDGLVVEAKYEFPRLWTNSYFHQRCLAYSCGELFSINVVLGGIKENEVIDIEVYKLNLNEGDWHKVTSAKDQLFFMDKCFALSCMTIRSETESGGVYFTLSEDKSLYSFNIEDGSLLVTLPCSMLPTPWCEPDWIMPTDPRFLTNLEVECINSTQYEEKCGTLELIRASCLDIVQDKNVLTPFCRLPFDVLYLISELLVLVDYINFRAVCRICRLVAPPIKCRTVLPKLECCSLSPWLIFPENNNGIHHFVDSKLGGRYLMNLPEKLVGSKIQCSWDGWLLMSRQGDSMFLYNPFTRDTVQFPPVSPGCVTCPSYGISASEESSEESTVWLVVGIFALGKTVDVYFATSMEDDWYIDCFENNLDFKTNNNTAAVYDEAFYFLGRDGNLAVLDTSREVLTWEVLEKPRKPCKYFHYNYLLECGGELLSVFVGEKGKWVKVYRLNNASMYWEKVNDLGDYALFVSRTSSFSRIMPTLEMRNRIYFPRFLDDKMVYYSLDDRKLHALGSQNSIPDFYNTREIIRSSWVEPTW